MRKNLRNLTCVLIVGALAVNCFTACDLREAAREADGNREPQKHVDLLDDPSLMTKYMHAVEEWDRIEYEQIYFTSSLDIGPHEFRFRGIVYLTDEEAQRLWDAYEWEETEAPEFEFDEVDTSAISADSKWYKCEQFNSDNYTTIVPYYTVFDGENLVFDIHQM